jgi:hypothetical protein
MELKRLFRYFFRGRAMPAEPPRVEQDQWDTRGVDPYADWALGPGRTYFFLPGRQDEWVPVLLQLTISVEAFAEGLHLEEQGRGAWKESVHVSQLDIEPEAAAEDEPYCTAMVREKFFFDALRLNKQVRDAVADVTLGLPLDSESLAPPERKATSGRSDP